MRGISLLRIPIYYVLILLICYAKEGREREPIDGLDVDDGFSSAFPLEETIDFSHDGAPLDGNPLSRPHQNY
jgi:hypothetical protein